MLDWAECIIECDNALDCIERAADQIDDTNEQTELRMLWKQLDSLRDRIETKAEEAEKEDDKDAERAPDSDIPF